MKVFVLAFVAFMAVAANARIMPDYLKTCDQNDPDIDDCFMEISAAVRSRVANGAVPELDIPSYNPLELQELRLSPPGTSYKVVGQNLKAYGATNYRITRFRSDLKHNTFYASIEFPFLSFEGYIHANIPTPFMRIKGAGPARGNATNIRVNAIVQGNVVQREGRSYYDFNNAELDVKVSDAKIRFEGLLGDNKIMEQLALNIYNERSREFAMFAEPIIERAATPLVLMYANLFAKHLPLDELISAPARK